MSTWVREQLCKLCNVTPSVAQFLQNEFRASTTVPFLARYRRDTTNNMTEFQLRAAFGFIEELEQVETKRARVFQDLESRGVQIDDSLRNALQKATSMAVLEELYEPFKVKRESKAEKARVAGFEPVATELLTATHPIHLSKEQIQEKDLLVALVSEALYRFPDAKQLVTDAMLSTGRLQSNLREKPTPSVLKKLLQNSGENKMPERGDAKHVHQSVRDELNHEREWENLKKLFGNYDHFDRGIQDVKPHQTLAIFRGEKRGVLKVSFALHDPEIELKFVRCLTNKYIGVGRRGQDLGATLMLEAVTDAYINRALPSAISAAKRHLLDQATVTSFKSFSDNLRGMLLQRPLGGCRLLAIDPGFRAGCKSVILDESGNLIHTHIFYLPFAEEGVRKQMLLDQWKQKLTEFIAQYKITKVVIGNGTASRDVETVIAQIIQSAKLPLEYSIVSEIGASVYSASDAANEEFPNLDILYRGAISIGRRVQNPLSELVKIPPKSLGVGMYQHDLDEKKLEKQLRGDVEACVAEVGLDVNQASKYALRCLPGLTETKAIAIVQFREKHGKFSSRSDLLEVPGISPKVFQEVAGFLRVPESSNPLDNTICHPESYGKVEALLKTLEVTPQQREELKEKVESYPGGFDALAKTIGASGVEETKLLVGELTKPRSDPRENLPHAGVFRQELKTIEDLAAGQKVSGVVRNVAPFGIFVDIGIGQSALIPKPFWKDAGVSEGTYTVGAVISNLVVLEVNNGKVSLAFDVPSRTTASAETPLESRGTVVKSGEKREERKERQPLPSAQPRVEKVQPTPVQAAPPPPPPPPLQTVSATDMLDLDSVLGLAKETLAWGKAAASTGARKKPETSATSASAGSGKAPSRKRQREEDGTENSDTAPAKPTTNTNRVPNVTKAQGQTPPAVSTAPPKRKPAAESDVVEL